MIPKAGDIVKINPEYKRAWHFNQAHWGDEKSGCVKITRAEVMQSGLIHCFFVDSLAGAYRLFPDTGAWRPHGPIKPAIQELIDKGIPFFILQEREENQEPKGIAIGNLRAVRVTENYCSCQAPMLVTNEAGGKKFFYCRRCKKEKI